MAERPGEPRSARRVTDAVAVVGLAVAADLGCGGVPAAPIV